MESRVSRLAVIAALALLKVGPATACPSDSSFFFAHSQRELLSFSSDVEDESVSSYIRELSAASIAGDVDPAIAPWELGVAIDALELLPSPAALTGLAGLSDATLLFNDEDDFTSAISAFEPEAEPTGSSPGQGETAEMPIEGQEDR
jgi:hypothetical protein